MSHTIVTNEPGRLTTAPPSVRIVRIALAGCGTVGGELLRLMGDQADAVERTHGLRFEVVRVLVRDTRRSRVIDPPRHLVTNDVDAFLATDADLVVEALGGEEPARRIIRHALDRGRAAVTANKALMAAHGAELAARARAQSATLGFEGAVAGGVPILRVLRESLSQTGVQTIRGILNGTTNYILTRMGEGASFATALAEARAMGFAEADPSRDLDGQDAADKIVVLAWQAFGSNPAGLRVERAGIMPDPDRLVADGIAAGGVVRLIGECVRHPDGLSMSVEPVVVPARSPFGQVAAEDNLIEVRTAECGTLRLSGPGAGGGPTAAAVLSDMLSPSTPPTAPDPWVPAYTADPRAHRWLVTVRLGADRTTALAKLAKQARVGLEPVGASSEGTYRAITGPLSRAGASSLRRTLKAAGLDTVVLRYGLTE